MIEVRTIYVRILTYGHYNVVAPFKFIVFVFSVGAESFVLHLQYYKGDEVFGFAVNEQVLSGMLFIFELLATDPEILCFFCMV